MTSAIETLETKYNETHAKAMEFCAEMIEADSKGNKLVASIARAKWNRLNDECGEIANAIARVRDDANFAAAKAAL